MEISKIVITGGPCAGKTTALCKVQRAFTKMGYSVVFVSEAATDLITGGISPATCLSGYDFQKALLSLQLEKEKIFEQAVKKLRGDKVLLICDRGALDNKAYMTEAEFARVLDELSCSEVELRDGYDAVFHLVTAAKGALEHYTTVNNAARTESPELAAELDDKLIAAWTGHPHLRVIDNSTDFEGKIRRLITEISAFLGEPEPLEIERKFLIDYPDIAWLESLPNCQRIEIIQTYLKSAPGEESRVRQRGLNGHYIYFQTTKKRITDIKRIEIERRLSEKEYLTLLMDADTTKHPIRKTRYCLTYDSQYFEIDVYPFWKDRATCEIELSAEDTPIHFPEWMKVIKEVTGNPEYKNSKLAEMK